MGVRLGGRTGPGWGHPSPGGPDGGDRESPCAVTGALQAVTGTTPGCSGGTPTAADFRPPYGAGATLW